MIRGELARELLAWMSMFIPMNELGISKDSRMEAQRIRTVNRQDLFAHTVSRGRLYHSHNSSNASMGVHDPCLHSQKYIALADCDELLSTGLCYYDEGGRARETPSWFVILKPPDIERWKCAAKLFIENPSSGVWAEYEGMTTMQNKDWPPLFKDGFQSRLLQLFTTAGILYGSLHLLPWASNFPTTKEKKLWLASAFYIISSGILVFIGFWIVFISLKINKTLELRKIRNSTRAGPGFLAAKALRAESFGKRFMTGMRSCGVFVGTSITLLLFTTLSAACLAYCLSRVFLVVESLRVLFHAEPGIFLVPSWSASFPHVT